MTMKPKLFAVLVVSLLFLSGCTTVHIHPAACGLCAAHQAAAEASGKCPMCGRSTAASPAKAESPAKTEGQGEAH